MASFAYHEIIATDEDLEELRKSITFKEESRMGIEMGAVYKKAMKVTIGARKDTQMKIAKGLYKTQSIPSFNSESKAYFGNYPVLNNLTMRAGFNRQGVWYPKDHNPYDGHSWGDNVTEFVKYSGFLQPILPMQCAYDQLLQSLIPASTISWLLDVDNLSTDLFYGLTGITSTVTFGNCMQFMPVDLKIYLCKCKERTQWAPHECWFSPNKSHTPVATTPLMRADYVYDAGAPADATSAGTSLAPNSAQTLFAEASVHVGSTPMYSPTFRNHWEIVDVIKQTIEPNDKFEFTFHREYRKCVSIRNLEEVRTTFEKGLYVPGDYALLTTFRGKPCFMKWSQPASSTQRGYKEVENSPCEISMSSRSHISVAAPALFTPAIGTPAGSTTASTTANYISGEGHILDTAIDTQPFSNQTDAAGWRINVMSNVSEQTGGSKS